MTKKPTHWTNSLEDHLLVDFVSQVMVRAVVAGIGSASIIFGGIFLLLGHTSLGGLVIVVGLVSVFIAFRPKT
jgi:hypothetical protein